jgi:hypothetical protein
MPHDPEQQSEYAVQADPADAHAQVPPVHEPEQHIASLLQMAPGAAHTHAPPLQVPKQQVTPGSLPHEAPTSRHVHHEFASTMAEQHSAAGLVVPDTLQQAPALPQTVPGSHCASTVHCVPADGRHR